MGVAAVTGVALRHAGHCGTSRPARMRARAARTQMPARRAAGRPTRHANPSRPCGTASCRDRTAWLPQPCSPSDMAAATMQYHEADRAAGGGDQALRECTSSA